MDTSTLMTTTLQMLFTASEFLFNLWFVLVFGALRAPQSKVVVSMWLFFAGIRVVSIFNPQPLPIVIIPEPYNTTAFVTTGIVLLLVWLVQRRHSRIVHQKKREAVETLNDLLNLSPTEFEEMIADIYRLAGHRARRTGAVGDNGVDIVVEAKNGEKWIVQCKRWRGSVSEPVVRDFYGAMQHEKADKGTIITTGKFSRPAQAWAKGKPISLYDGEQLLKLWKRSKNQKQSQSPVTA